jgi:hypothetical protein
MEPPARLPETEADLAEWSVYIDWLLQRGDRRGDLLALELALPADPTLQALGAWRGMARHVYRDRPTTPIGWCLGHVRTLGLGTPLGAPPISRSILGNAHGLMRSEPGWRVEHLEVLVDPDDDRRPWRRLFAGLPASCRRVTFKFTQWSAAWVAELIDLLPESVRELEVSPQHVRVEASGVPRTSIGDRFDVVGFGGTVIDPPLAEEIADALSRSHAVKVRVSSFAAPLPWDRCLLGGSGDGALLQPDLRAGFMLPRWTLLTLQRRFGPVPVRAQLAATLPEDHLIHGMHLVRRGSSWTLHRTASVQVHRAGAPLLPDIVPLLDGDHLAFRTAEYVFVAGDPTETVRAWC